MRPARPLVLLLLTALALAAPAAAQERRPAPKQQEGVVQPQQPAQPAARSRPARAIASAPPVITRAGPTGALPTDPPVAPRMGGLAPQGFGGAACRTSCSTNYIFCQQQDDLTSCSASWARCQASCPAISASE
jgi:hypothetical protein